MHTLISKTARKYALNTQYALNNEGKNCPHTQNHDAFLVARVHDRRVESYRLLILYMIVLLKFASDEGAG